MSLSSLGLGQVQAVKHVLYLRIETGNAGLDRGKVALDRGDITVEFGLSGLEASGGKHIRKGLCSGLGTESAQDLIACQGRQIVLDDVIAVLGRRDHWLGFAAVHAVYETVDIRIEIAVGLGLFEEDGVREQIARSSEQVGVRRDLEETCHLFGGGLIIGAGLGHVSVDTGREDTDADVGVIPARIVCFDCNIGQGDIRREGSFKGSPIHRAASGLDVKGFAGSRRVKGSPRPVLGGLAGYFGDGARTAIRGQRRSNQRRGGGHLAGNPRGGRGSK